MGLLENAFQLNRIRLQVIFAVLQKGKQMIEIKLPEKKVKSRWESTISTCKWVNERLDEGFTRSEHINEYIVIMLSEIAKSLAVIADRVEV